MGKIFHPGAPSGNDDRAYSWSLPYYRAPNVAGNHKVWESFEGYTDDQLQDGKLADNAVQILQELKLNRSKGDNRPFFVAVGFHKPHVPWYAPSKYYDLYPPAQDIQLPENPDVPQDFPPVARAVITPFINFIDVKPFYPNLTKCFTDVQASFYGAPSPTMLGAIPEGGEGPGHTLKEGEPADKTRGEGERVSVNREVNSNSQGRGFKRHVSE